MGAPACHRYIANVAMEAAANLYENLMSDNRMYAMWREQNPGASPKILLRRFVRRNWPRCIPFARATLARLLTQPIDEALKEEITQALILDATLVDGRKVPSQVIGSVRG